MKIGILIKDFNALGNWELRIIEEIKNDPSLELAVLIRDGRTDVYDRKSNIKRFFKTGNVFGKLAFRFQEKIERKFFFKGKHTVDRDEIMKYLNDIPNVVSHPKRKGFFDIFREEDADPVKAYNLDIILRHEFNIIKGPILDAAKYGIWSFHHGDNAVNRGGPAGMWEIILKQAVVGVTLQQLTPVLDGGLVIDKAFFNCYWSYAKNNNMILEGSVALLFKNIRRVQRTGEHVTEPSPPYNLPLYKVPKFGIMMGYIFRFYPNIIRRAFEVMRSKMGARYYCWTLFLGEGNFTDAELTKLEPIRLPKDEFWADPFLFSKDGTGYVFFESYSYKTKVAKICVGRVEGNKIVDVKDALTPEYHLSYPMIIEEGGDIFMLPESSNNNRMEVYKCVDFPAKWELHTTAFEGEQVSDCTYFVDDQSQPWLFVNKSSGVDPNFDVELYIYQVDSLQFNTLTPHQQNPVLIDCRNGRSGGAIFRQNGKLIRPSQINTNGVYGYGLNLGEITTLTLEDYSETQLQTIEPDFQRGMVGVHHLHQIDGKFVIDGAFRKY